MNIQIREMISEDCSQVTALLQANAQSNHGRLYGEYPQQKVHAMYQSSLHTLVATTNNNTTIIAVLFSFPVNTNSLPSVALEIRNRFSKLTENNWFYGPVCIESMYRGQFLLPKLYQQLCELNEGYPIAFINSDNTRSIKAHIKIGMNIAAEFNFQSQNWLVMIGK